MNFILYSDIGENTINKSLGLPEYSYYFVLKAFRTVLQELGTVTVVRHPETEVDPLFDACRARGEECVFLSFSPPNKTLIDLRCPTVSVFAWEYSNIPDELWDEDVRNDWRIVFGRHGRAITLSSYTARIVREAMGPGFPVLAVPAPLWEQFAEPRARFGSGLPPGQSRLQVRGTVIDSHVLGLSADGLIAHVVFPQAAEELDEAPPQLPPEPVPEPVAPPAPPVPAVPAKNLRYRLAVTKRHLLTWYREALRDLLPLWLARAVALGGRGGNTVARAVLGYESRTLPPLPPSAPQPARQQVTPVAAVAPTAAVAPEPQEPEVSVVLEGVVYTSILSPKDGRKNWFDMVTAFCWTFREVEDVTLVLKMNERDLSLYHNTLLTLLSQLAPFKCRVLTLHAYLDDATYEELIGATSFYVNTSLCEGLCLPLMEFMSCGRPVIAPRHTAMEDYIDEGAAFIIKSSLEHNVWPHDPRDLFRTLRYRLDWESICNGYAESYQIAKQQPEKYLAMGRHAIARMQSYSAGAVVKEQLREFFQQAAVEEQS
ncbi:glycosyltransferase [Collimonas pratensis]|uniref:Glycosyl transferases group 1 family protein n=1 Tax=Collimonas pratensis TaxID=279113 RepID=A0ABN4MKW5_9BURK|nr:glycosyltransferase [Collimonas pratensis]AMP16222.1 glycosyl transferases group 1 family protein [Collimonas pratensis]